MITCNEFLLQWSELMTETTESEAYQKESLGSSVFSGLVRVWGPWLAQHRCSHSCPGLSLVSKSWFLTAQTEWVFLLHGKESPQALEKSKAGSLKVGHGRRTHMGRGARMCQHHLLLWGALNYPPPKYVGQGVLIFIIFLFKNNLELFSILVKYP